METTSVPTIEQPPHSLEELSSNEDRSKQVEQSEETPVKKMRQTQHEFPRDPRLRGRESGPNVTATEKNMFATHTSNKMKATQRPHPYAIYGRTKEGSKKDSTDEKSAPQEDRRIMDTDEIKALETS
ncbi:hypothetical protein ANN_26092 [Periplaneta americana]|uniref:Uncharacterized protein n=1 Tax=Periplaneta americana TaxID=6978 RepID=A0ABQ8S5E6_PERAM|nr:hypothetical protein ANN_26092 [Periplaneta americana]